MGQLFDLVKVTVSAGGSGTITVGGAVSGFRSFSVIPDGTLVSYGATDGTNRETGTGIKSGSTLTRTLSASTTGALLDLSTAATITITPNAGDFAANEFRLGPRSGAWFGEFSDVQSGAILTANLIHYVPIIVSEDTIIDRLAIWAQSGGAGFNCRLGIYRPDASRLPGALISECATPVALSGFGRREGTFGTNPRLARGLYWGASLPDAGTPQVKTISTAAAFFLRNSIGNADSYAGVTRAHVIQNGSYASGLPANASGLVVQEGFMPLLMARAA